MATKSNFTPYTAPMFSFEESFDQDAFHTWIVEAWTQSIWYSLIYIVLIFGGRYYMAKRERFELRMPLALWSSFLAAFSIFGAVRTIPELYYILKNYGFESSVCNPSYFYGNTAFWAYIFTISKLYELGDTLFIVLRKQPLIFLHWYHHVTVFIYVWYSYTDHTAPGRWFMVMNYTVHSFMYTYYALKAMRLRIPRRVNIFITGIQILQMIMGVAVILKAQQYKAQGHFCQQSRENMRYCFLMYSSYLVLFSHFFYNTYLKPKPAAGKAEVQMNGVSKCSNGVEKSSNGVKSTVQPEVMTNGISKKIQ
jgi:elongation of very long chain fatty acids protein 6